MSSTALYKAFIEAGASEDGATKAAEDIVQVSQLPQLATKTDIAILKSDIEAVRSEIAIMRSEIAADIGSLRSNVTADIGSLRSDVTADIGSLRSDVTADIGSLRSNVTADIGSLRSDVTVDIGSLRSGCSGRHCQPGNPVDQMDGGLLVPVCRRNHRRCRHSHSNHDLRKPNPPGIEPLEVHAVVITIAGFEHKSNSSVKYWNWKAFCW